MIRIFLVLTFLAFATQTAFSNTSQRHFLKFKAITKSDRSYIARFLHIDSIDGENLTSTVDDHGLKEVNKHLSKFLVSTRTINLAGPISGQANEYEYPAGDEKYHTYSEVVSELNEFARRFPKIATRFSLGSTVEGRDIPGIRITGVADTHKDQFTPGIFFVGAHHAREHLSVEVPMLLIKLILEQYETNPEIKKLVDSRDIYFVPMLNSDGAMHDIKGRRYKYWRKNRVVNNGGSFGVDLNRNYSFGWGTGGSSRNERSDVFMGPKPFSEPETAAVKKFVEEHANIRVLLSFHTYSELILYPWGGKHDGVGGKDQRVFEKLAQTMAKWNNYKPEQASDLYIASGDTCDWAYGQQGIFCFTFELSPKSRWSGGGFYPGAATIDKAFKANIKPALYLIDKAGDPYSVIK